MTQFEFLMTFASVILAISMTEMLGGWGKLIRSTQPIRWSGLWIGWSLLVMGIIIMYWSGMWPYRDESFREGYKILWLAIPTFFLVVLGFLLSPEPENDAHELDLEDRYWQVAPRMFPLLASFLICSALADVVISGGWARVEGRVPGFLQILLPGGALSLIVAAGFIRKPWLHWLALAPIGFFVVRFLIGDFEIFR